MLKNNSMLYIAVVCRDFFEYVHFLVQIANSTKYQRRGNSIVLDDVEYLFVTGKHCLDGLRLDGAILLDIDRLCIYEYAKTRFKI